MEGFEVRRAHAERPMEDGWTGALNRSRATMRREGFTVSHVRRGSSLRGARPPDLLATNGARVVRVFVLLDRAVDAEDTRRRISAAYRHGETRVFVRWALRWRMLSNVDRWGLRGVAVTTW